MTVFRVEQFAASEGKDAAQVVQETVTRVLERREQFLEGVDRGIAQAGRGELIDDEEVRLWLEQHEQRS